MFMVFSLRGGSERIIMDLPDVCKFPEVFLDDISNLSLEREFKFAIDLVPGTSPMFISLYRMYALELSELKKP